MLALRQNLRLAVRPARTLAAGRGYVTKREVAEEIKEDKEGWTENSEVSPRSESGRQAAVARARMSL